MVHQTPTNSPNSQSRVATKSILTGSRQKANSQPLFKNTSLVKDESKSLSSVRVFEAVEKLKEEAGVTKTIDFDWYDVERFQNTVFADIGPFVGEDRPLVLFLSNGHFSGVRSVCNLLKTKYFCGLCLTKYRDVASRYNCKLIHRACGSKDCPTTEEDVPIDACQVIFQSAVCFENHKMEGPRKGKSRCAETKFCKRCQTSYYINKNRRGHKFYRRCEYTVPEDQ